MADLLGYPTNIEILATLNASYFEDSFFVLLLNDTRSVFAFTADTNDTTITATAHDYILNTPVQVAVSGGGTLPAPLVTGTTYYVRDVATDTFKLSTTIDGAAIDITTLGTGTFSITDLTLDSKLGTVALYKRKELTDYQGLGVRPTVVFSDAPVVGSTAIAITKTIALNNMTGVGDLSFDKFLLIRGGSSAIGNTTGTPAILGVASSQVVIIAGQADALTAGVSRAIPA
jgi:hypothetical protein